MEKKELTIQTDRYLIDHRLRYFWGFINYVAL